MSQLENINFFHVKQQKKFGRRADRFGDGFTNQYAIYGPNEQELYLAAEHTGTLSKEAIRKLYKKNRPFEIEVHDPQDATVLKVIRQQTRRYFHEVEIRSGDGKTLGHLTRHFNPTCRIYWLEAIGFQGHFTLRGSYFDRLRFVIEHQSKSVGELKKLKLPAGKKSNRCDDEFEIRFSEALDTRLKLIFLGSVFLIDFVYFES